MLTRDKAFPIVADYLAHYGSILSRYRDMPINLLEIGIFHGASLRVWRRFFSRATVVGVNINPACKRFEGDRAVVRIGSQADPEFLVRVAAEFLPPTTIIIDDGSHRAEHIVFTFDRLFPMLAPGGATSSKICTRMVTSTASICSDRRPNRQWGPRTRDREPKGRVSYDCPR